jgi:hypothetical protein
MFGRCSKRTLYAYGFNLRIESTSYQKIGILGFALIVVDLRIVLKN